MYSLIDVSSYLHIFETEITHKSVKISTDVFCSSGRFHLKEEFLFVQYLRDILFESLIEKTKIIWWHTSYSNVFSLRNLTLKNINLIIVAKSLSLLKKNMIGRCAFDNTMSVFRENFIWQANEQSTRKKADCQLW